MTAMRRLLIALLLSSLGLTAAAQTFSYHAICQDVVIDVRTPHEFADGHIHGAINIPLDQLDKRIGALPGIDKSSRILVYCRSGRRSELATEILQKHGYRHVSNAGGYGDLGQKLTACLRR